MNSLLLTDGYKTSHHKQYPKNTTLVFSNFTPRSDKYAPKSCQGTGVVVFGVQLMLKQIHEHFDKNFFKTKERKEWEILHPTGFQEAVAAQELNKIKEGVINEIKNELDMYLGSNYDVTHFEELWDLGYLPIEVRALEEGTVCPIRVPMLTIHNTKPEFFWVTNYLETIISNLLWKPMTSATIAKAYKEILVAWANKTDKDNVAFVDWQGHDFSMRGMDSVDATISSGLGHLTSFLGTDSLPAIWGARHYYGETGFVAGSVPATEHSVMCAGSKEDELGTFKRLMETYPTGILSVVSDTWDLWNVITNILPQLKEQVLSRDGKLVIRPDSGDPVDILCGIPISFDFPNDVEEGLTDIEVLSKLQKNPILVEDDIAYAHYNADNTKDLKDGRNVGKIGDLILSFLSKKEIDYDDMYHEEYYYYSEIKQISTYEQKGVIELLWDIFGGTINEQGYKVLDPHIGAIYGDSITTDRAWEICQRLEAKGFASTNVVLGIGSFTYQYNTRDTFGFAMKATYVERDGKGFEIFKDPVTDSGMKKSAKGLLKVVQGENGYELVDQITWEEFQAEDNELKLVYLEGSFYNEKTLTEIRNTVNNGKN